MVFHDWEYDTCVRVWHCRVCAKPVTGRGPNRPPDPAGCEGTGAYVNVARPWGRWQDDGGGLDEVVVESKPGAEIVSVHIERMGVGSWWGAVSLADGTDVVVNLWSERGMPRVVTGRVEEERPT